MLRTGTTPDSPQTVVLAGDGRGGAVAVWTASRLEGATFAPASGWGPVETLDNEGHPYFQPSVVVSANGDSVATWVAADGRGVRAMRRASGSGTWQGVTLLGEGLVDQPPRLGIDDEGAAVLTWAESASGIWVARLLPGTGWEQPRVLEPLLYAPYHDLVVNSRGLVTVPYIFFPDAPPAPGPFPGATRWQTCGIHLRTSGALGTLVDCVEPPWRAFGGELVAADAPDGRTLAVWTEPQGSWPPRSAAWWHPHRGWSERTTLGTGSGAPAALAVDGQGAAVVLVTTTETPGVWAHRYEPDRGWLPAEDLLTPGAKLSLSASIALEATGGGWAAWSEGFVGGARIVAGRYVPSKGWSPPVTVASEHGSTLEPKVVVDGRGGALVVWKQGLPGGSTISVVARQFVADTSGP